MKHLFLILIFIFTSAVSFAEEVCNTWEEYRFDRCQYYEYGLYGNWQTDVLKNWGWLETNYYPNSFVEKNGPGDQDDILYNAYGYCDIEDTRVRSECNERPVSNFYVNQENSWPGGSNRVTFISNSHDSDGNIVEYEWFVDGVKQSSTTYTMRLYNSHPINSKTVSVKLKIKDNGGLLHSKTKSVELLPYSCNEPFCTPY